MTDDFDDFCSAGGGTASPASSTFTWKDCELLWDVADAHSDEQVRQQLRDLNNRIWEIVQPNILAEVQTRIKAMKQGAGLSRAELKLRRTEGE